MLNRSITTCNKIIPFLLSSYFNIRIYKMDVREIKNILLNLLNHKLEAIIVDIIRIQEEVGN
jgi:hypothetical protein